MAWAYICDKLAHDSTMAEIRASGTVSIKLRRFGVKLAKQLVIFKDYDRAGVKNASSLHPHSLGVLITQVCLKLSSFCNVLPVVGYFLIKNIIFSNYVQPIFHPTITAKSSLSIRN